MSRIRATCSTYSAMRGNGAGLMSSRTISASCKERVLAMSLSSDGAHWLLPPPMITIRGATRSPLLLARAALDFEPEWQTDRLLRLLDEMRDQAGGAGDQHDAACARRWQPEVDQRGAARARAVDRQVPARALLVHQRNLLEQTKVRAEQTVLRRDRVQPGRARVDVLVHGVAEAGHPLAGGASCVDEILGDDRQRPAAARADAAGGAQTVEEE